MKRIFLKVITVILALSMITACGSSEESGEKGELVIGSKTYTEGLVLGSLMTQYLESIGYSVKDETGLGETAIMRAAITSGEIDGYFEYTGTGIMNFMEEEPVFDEQEAYELIRSWDEENGLTWLPYAPANNTYVMVATPEVAERYGLKKVSDLAKAYNEGESIVLVTASESYERPDMMPRLMDVYGFEVPMGDRLNLELGMFYEALKNKEGDVTTGFATDGIINKEGFVALEDDKDAFAVYNIAPVFRTETLEEYPELSAEILKLTNLITDEVMMDLNAQVDIDGKSAREVAEKFLKDNNLI